MRRFVSVHTGLGNHTMVTTFNFLSNVGGSPADQKGSIVFLWNSLAGKRSNLITTRTLAEYDEVDALSGITTNIAVAGADQVSAGTGTAEPLPLQVQGLIRLRTAQVILGRRLQGHLFVPGITESQTLADGRGPSGDVATAVAVAQQGLIEQGLAVYHKPNPSSSVPGGIAAQCTSVALSNTWATQRRRLR